MNRRLIQRKLEGAGAAIDQVVTAVGLQPRHERVEQVEAATAKNPERRRFVALDVRRQDAR